MPFVRGEFHFSNPICTCYHNLDFGGYKWVIPDHKGLMIMCNDCGTSLIVPFASFLATVVVHEAKNPPPSKLEEVPDEEPERDFKLIKFPEDKDEV